MNFYGFGYYLKSVFTLLQGIKNPGVIISLLFRKSDTFAARVVLRNGATFFVHSLMDVWIIKETCLDRQYELASLPLQDGWTIVDIGAAFGDYAVWAASQVPHGRLVAVEPYPPSISLLRSNLERNRIFNAEIFGGAVTSTSGITTLIVEEGKAVQNSTVCEKDSSRSVEVETRNLRELLEEYSITKCDYLKLDCEGGEYDILFSAPPDTLARLERICMEVHDGVTSHDHREMISFLEQQGYTIKLTPNPVHKHLACLYAEKSSLLKGRS